MTFKLATFNVHYWRDSQSQPNMIQVHRVIQEYKPDILCLQEAANPKQSKKFMQMCDWFTHFAYGKSCAILSKFPLQNVITKSKNKKVRRVTVKIRIRDDIPSLYLTNLHLNYVQEPIRQREIDSVVTQLKLNTEIGNRIHVWSGDFNALSRDDYSESEWNQIALVRRRNDWEPPQTSLTDYITSHDRKGQGLNFIDSWVKAGSPKPIKTCRFDTRIDYIYVRPELFEYCDLINVQQIEDNASDHNMVMAEFKMS